ncbi:DUF1515 domain-containing protein [Agrobacterium rhizogenes]|nr:DUF1515 domain-containing protein [Rhizobium rhizogenes]
MPHRKSDNVASRERSTPSPEDGEGLAEVRNLGDALRRSEIKSDSSRASMHQDIWIMLVERVSRVEGNSAAVQEDVSKMRPVTDDVKSWKRIAWMLSASLDLAAWRLGVTFADAFRRLALLVLGK